METIGQLFSSVHMEIAMPPGSTCADSTTLLRARMSAYRLEHLLYERGICAASAQIG